MFKDFGKTLILGISVGAGIAVLTFIYQSYGNFGLVNGLIFAFGIVTISALIKAFDGILE